MAIDFTLADNDSVYGAVVPADTVPLRVTVCFTRSAISGSIECLWFCGSDSNTADYAELAIDASGHAAARNRESNSSYVATSNTISTSGVNVATAIFLDNGDSTVTYKVKLNGGSVASSTLAGSWTATSWNRTAFGRFMDSSPSNPFDGTMEQPFVCNSDDSFADHDEIWNSGSPLNPSGVTLTSCIARWPFDNTSGAVAGTDTYIDDAVGSSDLSAVGGSPVYAATIFTAGGGADNANLLGGLIDGGQLLRGRLVR